MGYTITVRMIAQYEKQLVAAEKSHATIEKYLRDIKAFYAFLPKSGRVEKETVIAYKQRLEERRAVSTANAAIAALNGFFAFFQFDALKVKPLKQQRRIFRDRTKELTKAEYLRLLEAANRIKNQRLLHIMQTLCATGVRISELHDITVEAVRSGTAIVRSKGKTRPVLLMGKLRKALLQYCREHGIKSGSVFVTKRGRPVNRSNVWGEMKRLCREAQVEAGKVFPHNFRHLFAVTFYNMKKDIAKLADLLGHASIETTRIYIMESSEKHAQLIERLGLMI
jgi:integrase/recombinase XerD